MRWVWWVTAISVLHCNTLTKWLQIWLFGCSKSVSGVVSHLGIMATYKVYYWYGMFCSLNVLFEFINLAANIDPHFGSNFQNMFLINYIHYILQAQPARLAAYHHWNVCPIDTTSSTDESSTCRENREFSNRPITRNVVQRQWALPCFIYHFRRQTQRSGPPKKPTRRIAGSTNHNHSRALVWVSSPISDLPRVFTSPSTICWWIPQARPTEISKRLISSRCLAPNPPMS